MADPTARTWNAWHVYLPHSMQTAYLRNVVAGTIEAAGSQGRFFFLRYWQGGPHLRLRFADLEPAAVDSVGDLLAAGLPELGPAELEEYTYELELQTELARLEQEDVLTPRSAGSVERAQYRPETGKYGGPDGVAIAEGIFCATSDAVLATLGGPAGVSNAPPVGDAVRIMALSLRGSGLDVSAALQFAQRYEDFWRRYVPQGQDEAWPRLYDRIGPSVTALCRSVWDGRYDDRVSTAYADALAAVRRHAGTDDAGVDALEIGGVSYGQCLANYVHTTNNRLGLIPAGEAFVGHVLRRSLHDVARS